MAVPECYQAGKKLVSKVAKSAEKKSSSSINSSSGLLSPRDYSGTWKQHPFGLILGEDSFLIERFVARLTHDAKSQGYEIRHIDANDKQWLAQIKTILTSPSLLSVISIFVVTAK